MTTTTQVTSSPNYKRPEYKSGSVARALCDALMLGTSGVRALGENGLPKWPSEKPEHYKIRASTTQVARYYQRTVQASTGMIVATPPALAEDANALMKADWEDIDGKGAHGEVFARGLCEDAINGGFCAILVDAPPVPDTIALTLADEQALGLRPFWVRVKADQVVSWIVDVPDWLSLLTDYAKGVLTAEQVQAYARQTIIRQVVIHEPTDVPDGTYGVRCADRYRVLRLTDTGVSFEVFERKEPDGKTPEDQFAFVNGGVMLRAGRKPFRVIPLAVVYAGRDVAPFVAEPPLLALAELNLDHYQVSADRRYLMRLCHAPTLFLAGFDDMVADEQDGTRSKRKIEVGPNSVLTSTNADAKATYVVAPPDALQSSKEEKDDLVDQMAALGMSFLARNQLITSETATARQLDDAAENSTHATVARGLQDGLEQALGFHAMYRGVEAPEITVNTTYAAPSVDPQIAGVLWQAVAADKLDVESWLQYVKTGDLPDDIAERLEVLRLVGQQQDDDMLAAQQKANAPSSLASGRSNDLPTAA